MQKNLIIILTFFSLSLLSQEENLLYEDHIYQDNIRSVTFHLDSSQFSPPIIRLNSNVRLVMGFDDMDSDVKDYVYSIQHCNKDWTPSENISESDYLDGFSEEEIDFYEFSFNTRAVYTHYEFFLPNDDMQFMLSGNYLLKIYEDEDEKRLVITRRFVVVEDMAIINAQNVRPSDVSKLRTHQEIDFTVEFLDHRIRNPRTELSATVLQNNRWDTAKKDLAPKFARGTSYVFDYTDEIVFPAGKEFRFVDLRDFERKTTSIYTIDRQEYTFDVYLHQDKKRVREGYFDWPDNNGNFLIETRKGVDGSIRAEYAEVLFHLYSPTEYYDDEVYIFGKLTDWKILPRFKMTFNPTVSAYVAKVELKQGYYDYVYAVVPKKSKKPKFDTTEGDWYEAENEYTILIYYRQFGSRYDRIIGARTIRSR